MKPALVLGLLFLSLGASVVRADDTTSVSNGGNSATVTQSGDPALAQKSVQTAPGRTRIEQRNGGNSAVIVQDARPGAPLPDDDDDDGLTLAPKPRADSGAGVDVYGVVRNQASPQGQANLDRLMSVLGIAKQR